MKHCISLTGEREVYVSETNNRYREGCLGWNEMRANSSDSTMQIGVSTVNGCYMLHADASRSQWHRTGPYLKGQSVNSMTYDLSSDTIYAATHTDGVFISRNGGDSWERSTTGLHVKKVWTVAVDPIEPATVYAGAHYGHLFRSNDYGATWSEVVGLHKAPRRNEWGIDWGFGTVGLCIHTIKFDRSHPERIYIIASGNGVYRTDDRGETWLSQRAGTMEECPVGGIRQLWDKPEATSEQILAEHLTTVHSCAHKISLSPSMPGVVYQQNHCGVYVSSDSGEKWVDRSSGKETRHGFAIATVKSPDGSDSVFTVPAYQGKCKEHNSCVIGSLEVFRGDKQGTEWRALRSGLPKSVHNCVLRDSMTTDSSTPSGIYFGTTTGEVYGSINFGETWKLLTDGVGRIQGVDSLKG